ncbi:MAG TPA: AAA family ATPase, partial [Verrucomicrobiae bacterium]|nr:AAA family ATPase [Verrucomicrobiae bacterium]
MGFGVLSLIKRFFRKVFFSASLRSTQLSQEQQHILRQLEVSSDHIFITGKAGTGKSRLLQHFTATTKKAAVIVAPTGAAAMAIKGQTIHSLFKLPSGPIEPRSLQVRQEVKPLLQHIDVVIIDEISMVRADTMEGINRMLQLARKSTLPFGGVQIIAFGDVYQLPPVVESPALLDYLKRIYGGPYFFNALIWKRTDLRICELQHVFRQSDEQFKAALDAIRDDSYTQADLDFLNTRVTIPEKSLPDGIIVLTT